MGDRLLLCRPWLALVRQRAARHRRSLPGRADRREHRPLLGVDAGAVGGEGGVPVAHGCPFVGAHALCPGVPRHHRAWVLRGPHLGHVAPGGLLGAGYGAEQVRRGLAPLAVAAAGGRCRLRCGCHILKPNWLLVRTIYSNRTNTLH